MYVREAMYQVQCIGFSGLANLLLKNDKLTELQKMMN